MSMAVETLLKGARASHPGDSNPARVMRFIRATPGEAWRAVEIADALGIEVHTLGAVLRRLLQRGLLDKQGVYWFQPTELEGARLAMIHATTQDLNERLGPEDPDDWF